MPGPLADVALWHRMIQGRQSLLVDAAVALSAVTRPLVVTALSLVVAALLVWRWRPVLALPLAVLTAGLASHVFKLLIGRERPGGVPAGRGDQPCAALGACHGAGGAGDGVHPVVVGAWGAGGACLLRGRGCWLRWCPGPVSPWASTGSVMSLRASPWAGRWRSAA